MEKEQEEKIKELSDRLSALEKKELRKRILPDIKKYLTRDNLEFIFSLSALIISASVAAIVLLEL